MEKILMQLRLQQHRGNERILLDYPFNSSINNLVRKLPGARYSGSLKKWHIPATNVLVKMLKDAVADVAVVDIQPLKEQLAARKRAPLITDTDKPTPMFLSAANAAAFKSFAQSLILKAYSPNTIRTYKSEFLIFLQILGGTNAANMSVQRLLDYMEYCSTILKLSPGTLHSRINALKFYYEQVLQKEKFFWEIPRPKKPLILPKVLNELELGRLFNAVGYLKHKAILFTAYSAGLRVSEVVNLEWKHIDRSRGQILIEQAKGKKDRYVTLSPVVEDILISYYKKSRVKPVKYVFEGPSPGEKYSARSAQIIFQRAKAKAGIKKEIGFHSLRHSFATHLLEKGTNVKYIQELLGHFSIKTTHRYLHVAREKLVEIKSPIDELWRSGAIDWDG